MSFDAISYEWDAGSNVAQLMVSGILSNIRQRAEFNSRLSGKRRKTLEKPPLHVRFMTDHSYAFDAMQKQGKHTQIAQTVQQLLDAVQRMGPSARGLLRIEARIWHHETLGSNHSKYFIQDGRRVILTGCNIDSFYDWVQEDGGPQAPRKRVSWHDTGLRMDGPIAAVLHDSFNNAWELSTFVASSKQLPVYFPRREFTAFREHPSDVQIMIASKNFNRVNHTDIHNPQDVSWLYLMAHAQKHIYIETPNINDSEFQLGVLNAVHRGVEVRLITGYKAGDDNQRMKFVGGGTNEEIIHRLQAFLATHDNGHLFKPRWYSYDGKSAVVGYAEGQSHTKYMSVDGEVFMTGSGNQDTQSWKHSRETNAIVFSKSATRKADATFFLHDWAKAVAVQLSAADLIPPSWFNSEFRGIA